MKSHFTPHKDITGTLSILLATLCWGFSGCSGQYLLHDLALPTPVVLCIRQISAGIILIALDTTTRLLPFLHPDIQKGFADTDLFRYFRYLSDTVYLLHGDLLF